MAPFRLLAKALALSATKVNTLLLEPPPVSDALLDITRTSLAPGRALPALLAPNALALAALVLFSALLAPIKLSLPRPLAPRAPRKPTLQSLELSSVLPALMPLLLVLPRALLVVECFSPV